MTNFLAEIYHHSFLPSLLNQSYSHFSSVPRAPSQNMIKWLTFTPFQQLWVVCISAAGLFSEGISELLGLRYAGIFPDSIPVKKKKAINNCLQRSTPLLINELCAGWSFIFSEKSSKFWFSCSLSVLVKAEEHFLSLSSILPSLITSALWLLSFLTLCVCVEHTWFPVCIACFWSSLLPRDEPWLQLLPPVRPPRWAPPAPLPPPPLLTAAMSWCRCHPLLSFMPPVEPAHSLLFLLSLLSQLVFRFHFLLSVVFKIRTSSWLLFIADFWNELESLSKTWRVFKENWQGSSALVVVRMKPQLSCMSFQSASAASPSSGSLSFPAQNHHRN